MERIVEKCPAKINLSLDVTGKRDDGYHLLKMIMQTVSLFDEIEAVMNDKGIRVFCDNGKIPCNSENTAYKAAKAIIDDYKIESGIDIFIKKRIPFGAGLGGGSADAAGVIRAMNQLFSLNMSIDDMEKLGVKVGADVPFCIKGGTSLAEGIGEKLTYLRAIPETWCVIAKPDEAISTAEVYKKLKIDEIAKHPDTERIIQYIENGDILSLSESMINVLETVATKDHPVIFNIKDIMMRFDALGSIMTGSGSAVFGIFENKETAEKCYNRLSDYLKEVFIVRTYNE